MTTTILDTIPKDKIIQPDEEGIIWLSPTKKFLKNIKIILGSLLISLPVTVALVAFFTTPSHEYLLIFLMLSIIPIGFLVYHLAHVNEISIGIDAERLYIQSYFRKKAVAKFKDVTFINNEITIDDVHLQLQFDRADELFDNEQMRYYIFPKLSQNKNINHLTLFINRLKNKETDAWLTVISLFIWIAYLFLK